MSLKDKAFTINWGLPNKNGEQPIIKVIKLSDAEEEIEKLKFYIDQIPESGKAALKEIQTLVELLKSDVRLFYGLKDIFQMKETKVAVQDKIDEITQTLKKYE